MSLLDQRVSTTIGRISQTLGQYLREIFKSSWGANVLTLIRIFQSFATCLCGVFLFLSDLLVPSPIVLYVQGCDSDW